MIIGIFFPSILDEDEGCDLELETTIDIYGGKTYDRYSVS